MKMADGFKEKKAFQCIDGYLYIDGQKAGSDQVHDFERRYPGRISASQPTAGAATEPDNVEEEEVDPRVDPASKNQWIKTHKPDDKDSFRFRFSWGIWDAKQVAYAGMALVGVVAALTVPHCPTQAHLWALGTIAGGAILFMGLVSL